jgi:hypothetical protein
MAAEGPATPSLALTAWLTPPPVSLLAPWIEGAETGAGARPVLIHPCTRSRRRIGCSLRAENIKIALRWESHRMTLHQTGRLASKRGRSPYGSCRIATPEAGERRPGVHLIRGQTGAGLLWSDRMAWWSPLFPGRPRRSSFRYRGESNLGLPRGELSKHLATSGRCAFEAASGTARAGRQRRPR